MAFQKVLGALGLNYSQENGHILFYFPLTTLLTSQASAGRFDRNKCQEPSTLDLNLYPIGHNEFKRGLTMPNFSSILQLDNMVSENSSKTMDLAVLKLPAL